MKRRLRSKFDDQTASKLDVHDEAKIYLDFHPSWGYPSLFIGTLTLFARATSCDVSPRNQPIRLAGYASRTRPASTILDPIEISVVLLEGFAQRCLMFSFDLLFVGSELEKIHNKLAKLAFRPAEIVLLASHNHFAPATDHTYSAVRILEANFVHDLAAASDGLVLYMLQQERTNATLKLFQGQLNQSVNRRRYWHFRQLVAVMGCSSPILDGPQSTRAKE